MSGGKRMSVDSMYCVMLPVHCAGGIIIVYQILDKGDIVD